MITDFCLSSCFILSQWCKQTPTVPCVRQSSGIQAPSSDQRVGEWMYWVKQTTHREALPASTSGMILAQITYERVPTQ